MSLKGSAESYIDLKGSMSLLKAIRGKSAYEIALLNGFEGTEEEWLETLGGKSAYEYAQEGGYNGTEEDYAKSHANIDNAVEQAANHANNAANTASRFSGQINQLNKVDANLQKQIDVLNEGGVIVNQELIEGTVENWLDEHPEVATDQPAGADYGLVKSGGDATITNGIIKVNSLKPNNDTGTAYVKTVPVHASDVAEIKMLGGVTYKDGDTLRSAPVSAVESVGVNLISFPYVSSDKTTNNGVNFSVNTDGSVALNGTASGTTYFCLGGGYYSGKKPIPKWLNEGETYTISGGVPTVAVELYLYDSTGTATTFTSKHVENAFQVPSGKSYYGIFIRVDTGVTVSETIYPMLNRGTTALPYTPYFKRALEIPEAVRPANGINNEVYDYIGFGEQKSVKRVGAVDMGTLTYTHRVSNGRNIFTAASIENIAPCKNTSIPINAVCEKFTAAATNETWKHGDMGYPYTNSREVEFVDNDYADVASFKAAMSGVMLYYELAEPIITDISDILGDNHIEVVEGGTLTFVNEHGYDVPSVVDYSASADVRIVPQSFNEIQKAQIRKNIGAISGNEPVDFKAGVSASAYMTVDGLTADTTPQFRNVIVVPSVPEDLSKLAIGDVIFVTG